MSSQILNSSISFQPVDSLYFTYLSIFGLRDQLGRVPQFLTARPHFYNAEVENLHFKGEELVRGRAFILINLLFGVFRKGITQFSTERTQRGT